MKSKLVSGIRKVLQYFSIVSIVTLKLEIVDCDEKSIDFI